MGGLVAGTTTRCSIAGHAPNPFPYYRPLTGKPGCVVPGSQYWAHPPDVGGWHGETSNNERSYQKRDHACVCVEKDKPLISTSYGKGTGYCSNSTAISSVSWMTKESCDFTTTYNEKQAPGFIGRRAFHTG